MEEEEQQQRWNIWEVTVVYSWIEYEINTDCKGIKYVTLVLDKIQDYRKKLDMTYKQNASYKITENNKKLHIKRKKEPGKITGDFQMCKTW